MQVAPPPGGRPLPAQSRRRLPRRVRQAFYLVGASHVQACPLGWAPSAMPASDAQQRMPADVKAEPEEAAAAAAAALAAVRSPPSRSAHPSAGASDSKDEDISDGSEEMEEQPQGRLSGSQSRTTLPSERGHQQVQQGSHFMQPGGYVPPQQLAQLQQLAMLAQPGGPTMFASPQSEGQAQRGRRNARQQEQNKQARGAGREGMEL